MDTAGEMCTAPISMASLTGEGVAEEIAESLAKKKGVSLKEIKNKSLKDWKEEQYDLLADALREHLDMKAIYQILKEEE